MLYDMIYFTLKFTIWLIIIRVVLEMIVLTMSKKEKNNGDK